MRLKIIFLGAGSAFTIGPENYQSNVLLELEGDNLLIDAGSDLKFSLTEQGKSYKDIKHVFISHLHNDHCGGLEWLALTNHFDPESNNKPILFASAKILPDLWEKSLSAALSTLPVVKASLDTFFTVQSIKPNEGFTWHKINFNLVQTVHYYNQYELMPSYGLFFSHNKTKVFYTSDTQAAPSQIMSFYEAADIIFHDCETNTIKSGVHAHYSELVALPAAIKKKMWLYHYNPGPLPDARKDGFLGFVVKGQSFTI